MREPPFVIDVPTDRCFLDDHCANCLELLPEDIDALFCSDWCSEISRNVRYMRSVFRDGRLDDPEVRQAVQTRNAFLLVGGYGALGRTLGAAVRSEVKVRDEGKCQQCGKAGTEIDHINGSSAELGNLQLLCGDCHRAKTADNMAPASPQQRTLLQALFLTRVVPEDPTLLADDEIEWQSRWRGLKAARKTRFLDGLAAVGFDYSGLRTRAEMILARDENFDDAGSNIHLTEDDDSGFGPDSYFARAMRKDD